MTEKAETTETAANGAAPLTPAELEALHAKAKERDDYYNRYLRALADFDNYQKRNRREQERFREDASRDILKDLVLVMDNLDLAVGASKGEGSSSLDGSGNAVLDAVTKGIVLVREQLLGVMARRGAEPLGTKAGDAFDPDRHEAVMAESVPGLAREEVGLVAREGWKLGTTVLRPASVQVRRPAPAGS